MSDPNDTTNDEPDTSQLPPESNDTGEQGEAPTILTLAGDIAPIENGYQQAADGSPVLGVNGLPKRKPGRPRKNNTLGGAAIAAGTTAPLPISPPAKSPVQRKANREASEAIARMLINTTVSGLTVAIGDEWQFESQIEADAMRGAVTAYIESKGESAITPEGMLTLALASYALPRAAHENTRQKLGKFFGGIWRFLTGAFKRD